MGVPRMMIRRWMVATAFIAVACWATFTHPFDGGVALMAILGGLFALGAMRRPVLFLGVAISLRLVVLTLQLSGGHDDFHNCYLLGSCLGATAGMIIRKAERSLGHRSRPPVGRTEVIASGDPQLARDRRAQDDGGRSKG